MQRNVQEKLNYGCKYYLYSTVLKRVDTINKDLGVVFDSELSFVSHCKEKIHAGFG